LPLRDAAYAIWRHKITSSAEGRVWPRRDLGTPRRASERSAEHARINHEHDFAQDGPTFDRLKRAIRMPPTPN